MKNKVIVSISLPATGKTYDFWVPKNMQVFQITPLVVNILESKERNFFVKDPNNTFALKDSGELIDQDRTLEELGLKNGTQLVLV